MAVYKRGVDVRATVVAQSGPGRRFAQLVDPASNHAGGCVYINGARGPLAGEIQSVRPDIEIGVIDSPRQHRSTQYGVDPVLRLRDRLPRPGSRSEEHTSELQ